VREPFVKEGQLLFHTQKKVPHCALKNKQKTKKKKKKKRKERKETSAGKKKKAGRSGSDVKKEWREW